MFETKQSKENVTEDKKQPLRKGGFHAFIPEVRWMELSSKEPPFSVVSVTSITANMIFVSGLVLQIYCSYCTGLRTPILRCDVFCLVKCLQECRNCNDVSYFHAGASQSSIFTPDIHSL